MLSNYIKYVFQFRFVTLAIAFTLLIFSSQVRSKNFAIEELENSQFRITIGEKQTTILKDQGQQVLFENYTFKLNQDREITIGCQNSDIKFDDFNINASNISVVLNLELHISKLISNVPITNNQKLFVNQLEYNCRNILKNNGEMTLSGESSRNLQLVNETTATANLSANNLIFRSVCNRGKIYVSRGNYYFGNYQNAGELHFKGPGTHVKYAQLQGKEGKTFSPDSFLMVTDYTTGSVEAFGKFIVPKGAKFNVPNKQDIKAFAQSLQRDNMDYTNIIVNNLDLGLWLENGSEDEKQSNHFPTQANSAELSLLFNTLVENIPKPKKISKDEGLFTNLSLFIYELPLLKEEANSDDPIQISKYFLIHNKNAENFLKDGVKYYKINLFFSKNYHISNSLFLGAARSHKLYGEGDNFRGEKKRNYGFLPYLGITLYEMIITILEQADAMHHKNFTEGNFLKNYQLIYDQLQRDLAYHTQVGAASQIQSYFDEEEEDALKGEFAVQILIELVEEQKLSPEDVFKALENMQSTKANLNAIGQAL
ncbi:MAG: hypothetical protein ABFQ95_03530 [Pseudomonadota bacterium]